MAVAIAHAAAKQHHRTVQQGLAAVLHRAELVQEVRELGHDERIAFGEPVQHQRIAVVMGKIVAGLGDADLWNGEPVALAAVHVRDHPRHVRAQGQHDEIKHGAPVFARLALGNILLEGSRELWVHLQLGHIQPGIEALGALFDVAHGVKVLIKLATVILAQRQPEGFGLLQHGIQNAVPLDQAGTLGGDATRFFAEEAVEHVPRIVLGRQRDAITGKCQRGGIQRCACARADGELQRREASVQAGHLCHQLVHRDRVLILARALRVDLGSRQPGIGADMRLPQAVGMMQPAEDREIIAMLFQRLQRGRQLVTTTCRFALPGHAVHPIGDVHKNAAAWARWSSLGAQRHHRIKQWQSHGSACASEEVAAGQQPALGLNVAHGNERSCANYSEKRQTLQ